jgi:signal peptidase I
MFRSIAAAALFLGCLAIPFQPASARSTSSIRYVTIQGDAMLPTLRQGEKVRVDPNAYRVRKPARYDIVLFRAVQAGQPDKLFVKRVIALPGETVSIHNGAVYINHRRLKESYIDAAHRAAYPYGVTKVPANDYFVLGDNRNNSQDSHLWGMLARKYIVGRVVSRK